MWESPHNSWIMEIVVIRVPPGPGLPLIQQHPCERNPNPGMPFQFAGSEGSTIPTHPAVRLHATIRSMQTSDYGAILIPVTGFSTSIPNGGNVSETC